MPRPLPISTALLRLQGVAFVYQTPALWGSYLRLCLHVWEIGAAKGREEAAAVCGDSKAVEALLTLGAISEAGITGDNRVTVAWVEELKAKEEGREERLAERARKAAIARWHAPKKRKKPALKPSTTEVVVSDRTRADTPLEAMWRRLWQQYRGLDWNGIAKHSIALIRCLKLAKGDADEVERRATLLLTSQDKFLQENAGPELLLSRWNNLGLATTKQAASREAATTMFDVFKEVK